MAQSNTKVKSKMNPLFLHPLGDGLRDYQRITPHSVRRDPQGVLNKSKALQRCALLRAFLFPALTTASY
jgi:hypothetical protein